MDTVINSGASSIKDLFHRENLPYTITGIIIIFILILIYVWFSTRVGYTFDKTSPPVIVNFYYDGCSLRSQPAQSPV